MTPNEIIQSMRAWALAKSDIHALFLVGSHGRGDASLLSDVDIAMETEIEAAIILECLKEVLPVYYHQIWDGNKIVLWVCSKCIKIDCWVVKDAQEVSKYFHGGGAMPNNNSWILFDDSGNLAERLHSSVSLSGNYQSIEWLNKKFVNQLEAASKHHARSDAFRYVFAMQIAHDSLVRLACHIAGETDFLHLPKYGHRILCQILPKWTSDHFGAEGYLPTANRRKRNLLECWKDLHNYAYEHGFDSNYNKSDVQFLEFILQRDFFWNLRDIADGVDIPIARGAVFRGASLVPYIGESILSQMLTNNRIEWIVDLRREEELVRHPYPADFPVKVFHCPTWNTLERSPEWPQRQPDWRNDYPGNLASMAPHIRRILELVASGRSGYIHCHAGRDRTGVICALILRMLGCSPQELRASYSLSSEADMEAIEVLINWFEDDFRFRSVLDELSVDESLMADVRNTLGGPIHSSRKNQP